jgi:hypothetical protein
MPLNSIGSNPIISAKFDLNIPSGRAESGTCTLFIRKAPLDRWIEIMTIHNRPFSSHNIIIDPSIYLGSGSSVKDLVNTEIRYNVLFLDIDGDDKINCSFDLEITQDGIVLVSKNESASKDNVQFVTFSKTFTLS